MTNDEPFMQQAIAEARLAAEAGEVPIGCVIVHDPTSAIIGRGGNRRLRDSDPTAHAEIIALREAGQRLGDWRGIPRLHALRHARALPDVCRGHRQCPHPWRLPMAAPIPRPGR